MNDLKGTNAVVSGFDRGIGFATASLLARNGANIIGVCKQPSPCSEQAVATLEKENIKVSAFYADFMFENEVKETVKKIRQLKVPIKSLVNCIGIGSVSLLPMLKSEELHRIFQINFFSTVIFTQGLFTPLTKSKGSIVNIASIAGMDGEAGNTAYGASKASLILFTRVLAKEMAPFQVKVNAVAPGMTDTDFSDLMGEKARKDMEEKSLMHRLAKPDEIAECVRFLVSDESSFITGQIIRADGGMI